eukprot:scaffold2684_cov124-Isochrysis_galbana.AAC.8
MHSLSACTDAAKNRFADTYDTPSFPAQIHILLPCRRMPARMLWLEPPVCIRFSRRWSCSLAWPLPAPSSNAALSLDSSSCSFCPSPLPRPASSSTSFFRRRAASSFRSTPSWPSDPTARSVSHLGSMSGCSSAYVFVGPSSLCPPNSAPDWLPGSGNVLAPLGDVQDAAHRVRVAHVLLHLRELPRPLRLGGAVGRDDVRTERLVHRGYQHVAVAKVDGQGRDRVSRRDHLAQLHPVCIPQPGGSVFRRRNPHRMMGVPKHTRHVRRVAEEHPTAALAPLALGHKHGLGTCLLLRRLFGVAVEVPHLDALIGRGRRDLPQLGRIRHREHVVVVRVLNDVRRFAPRANAAVLKGKREVPNPQRQVPRDRDERLPDCDQSGDVICVLVQHHCLAHTVDSGRDLQLLALGPEPDGAVVSARDETRHLCTVQRAKHGALVTQRRVHPRHRLPPPHRRVGSSREEDERVLAHLARPRIALLSRPVEVRQRLHPVGVGAQDGGGTMLVVPPDDQLTAARRGQHLARLLDGEEPLDALVGPVLVVLHRLCLQVLADVGQRARVVHDRLGRVGAHPQSPGGRRIRQPRQRVGEAVDLGNALAVARPDADGPIEPTRDQQVVVRVEGHRRDGAVVRVDSGVRVLHQRICRVHRPARFPLVVAVRERGERRVDARRVPDPQGAVVAGREDLADVGVDDAPHRIL